MNFPKISLVIPSYNQGRFLEETILSVVNQQYPNLELFVIDGRSSDNSIEIIKKYVNHITWWVSEKDNGQSEAINKGFTRASGEIISWLCSDDLLLPGALKTVASHFAKAPGKVGLIHGGTILFDAEKDKETRFTYQIPCREAYLSGIVFPQPAAFFRKSYLDKVGLLNEFLDYGMDYDLFVRLSLICDFLQVNEVLAKYRLHPESKSISQSNRFISDWKNSFLNMTKNLQWSEELTYLKKVGLYNGDVINGIPYRFEPDGDIVSAIDKKKVLFFHLGHILKDLYWIGAVDQAKEIKKIMERDFKKEWWSEDPRLNVIAAKLNYPAFALKLGRAIKAKISNRKF